MLENCNVCVVGEHPENPHILWGVAMEIGILRWGGRVMKHPVQGEMIQAFDCVLTGDQRCIRRRVLEDTRQEPLRAPCHEGLCVFGRHVPQLSQCVDTVLADFAQGVEATLNYMSNAMNSLRYPVNSIHIKSRISPGKTRLCGPQQYIKNYETYKSTNYSLRAVPT